MSQIKAKRIQHSHSHHSRSTFHHHQFSIMQLFNFISATALAVFLMTSTKSNAQSNRCTTTAQCPPNHICTNGRCIATGGPSFPPGDNPGNGGDCVRSGGRCGSGFVGVGGGSCCNGLSCRNSVCQSTGGGGGGGCLPNGYPVGTGSSNANRCCSRYTWNGEWKENQIAQYTYRIALSYLFCIRVHRRLSKQARTLAQLPNLPCRRWHRLCRGQPCFQRPRLYVLPGPCRLWLAVRVAKRAAAHCC